MLELKMKEYIVKINDENFTDTVAQGVVLVDFYADWCGPCRMLSPILEALASEMDGKMQVAKLDVDHAPNTTTTYQITSVPTMIVFKNGKEADRIVGLKDLETLKKIVSRQM
jgi:thioredoxin 1